METVRLRPTADTTLFETTPTNNLGGVLSLAAGTTARSKRSRALIRFDLTGAIPSNAVIVDASLTLTVVRAPSGGGGVDSMFGLHRMLRSWTEGNKTAPSNGSTASSGEPTWLARAHPSDLWSTPGAAALLDFTVEPSSEVLVGGLSAYKIGGLANDVEFWRTNPNFNFGWILISQDEATATTARRFGAREDTNNAPELEVQFQVPLPPAPSITGPRRSNGGIRFQFAAQPFVSYAVEHRGTIATDPWFVLTNFGSDTVPRNVVVADVPGASNRFYRVVAR